MTTERYRGLRRQLLHEILRGDYAVDGRLPTEWQLVDRHGVSRVTVRKALEALRRDGVVESAPRRGTVVAQRSGGFPTGLDQIALIAPAHMPFFADFMQRFDALAWQHGALALFKQDYAGSALADEALFLRLVERGIRNAVVWPHTPRIDLDLVGRLRAVGINLVCFDQVVDSPLVDVVAVDHVDAIERLLVALGGDVAEVALLGYGDGGILSETLRQDAFRERCPAAAIHRIPRGGEDASIAMLLRRLRRRQAVPPAFLCTNGTLGLALDRVRAGLRRGFAIATIDRWQEMDGRELIAYQQPMAAMAEAAFDCLHRQCREGERWRGGRHLLPGSVVHTRHEGPR